MSFMLFSFLFLPCATFAFKYLQFPVDLSTTLLLFLLVLFSFLFYFFL